MRIRAAFSSGQIHEAQLMCDGHLDEFAKDVQALELRASIAMKQGKPTDAIGPLRQLAELQPERIELLYSLATAYRLSGQFLEALELFKRVQKHRPNDPSVLNELGNCCIALGRFDDAINALQNAIEIQPNAAVLHHNLGNAFHGMGRKDDAKKAYQQALHFAPGDPNSYSALAVIAVDENDRRLASDLFKKAYTLEPASIRGLLNLAQSHVEGNDLKAAEGVLREIISREPRSHQAYALLGKVHQRLGRFDEAKQSTLSAISIQPRMVSLYSDFVREGKFRPQDESVLGSIRSLLNDSTVTLIERKNLLFTLGKAYDDVGEYEEAMRAYDQANAIALEILGEGVRVKHQAYAHDMDVLMESFTPEFFLQHQELGLQTNQPIFIVGMMRSGTTLVEQILSNHSKVGAAGELTYWLENGQTTGKGIDAGMGSRYLSLLRSIDSHSERVTDKMPNNYLALGLIHLYLPNAKIIHCRRNPIDTCLSIYFTPGMPPEFAHNKSDLVFIYDQYRKLMRHWHQVIPQDRILAIDYEHLVDNHEAAIAQMLDFCGLTMEAACLAPEKNMRAITTPSLWQARQPIYRSSVERWRNYEPWIGEFRQLLEG